MNVGERIRQRRKQIGLSVAELAEKLGENKSTIYRYENSEIENLPLDILEPLAKILKVSPSFLIGWEDENWIKRENIGGLTIKKVIQLSHALEVSPEKMIEMLLKLKSEED